MFELYIKIKCKGAAYLIRYADDFVCCFEKEEDAIIFYEELKDRLKKFDLELAEGKSRIIPFGNNNSNQTWNNGGENASTTSNIYGVYDMSGGLWERTLAFIANGTTNLNRYGASIAYSNVTMKTVGTKYTTPYSKGTSDLQQNNWEANAKIYGDGACETSTAGTGSNSFNKDYSLFPATSDPLFERGGRSVNGDSAGVFAFSYNSGRSHYGVGFRTVLT